jgi:hypothetical protein
VPPRWSALLYSRVVKIVNPKITSHFHGLHPVHLVGSFPPGLIDFILTNFPVH